MAHNSVWGAIATATWPEAQSNATAGINWKQLCLLYLSFSLSFPFHRFLIIIHHLCLCGSNPIINHCYFLYNFKVNFMTWQRYHSKTFPHLVLRDYTGSSRGRFHIVSCLFIGDDSEMGGAESVFFLNKISKGSNVSRASLKGNH